MLNKGKQGEEVGKGQGQTQTPHRHELIESLHVKRSELPFDESEIRLCVCASHVSLRRRVINIPLS